jgi:uncharacterized delta-60 repeat protein
VKPVDVSPHGAGWQQDDHNVKTAVAITISVPLAGLTALAQGPAADDFNAGFGENMSVSALVVQTDGKVLIGGGDYTNGMGRSFLTRLHPDGSRDSSFHPELNTNGGVNALAVQGDGRILAAGSFNSWAGQPVTNLVRLHADGALDSSFNTRLRPGSRYVLALAVQPDGKILIVGNFTIDGDGSRINIARLNSDGTVDATFRAAPEYFMSAVVVQADGKILVAGDTVRRLNPDGTPDATFTPVVAGAPEGGAVGVIALQADGKILLGGDFWYLNDFTRPYLARLNADGTSDATFAPTLAGGCCLPVHSLTLQADGKILVGGYFEYANRQRRNSLARLHPDGTLDAGFNPTATVGSFGDVVVYSTAVQPDGKVLVGGCFGGMGGQLRTNLVRLHATESATQSLSATSDTVTWLRGGSGPEALWTRFDFSVDGRAWTDLGTGTRISGGWRATAVDLPPRFTLRARAYVGNVGSGWIADSQTGWPTSRVVQLVITNGGVLIRAAHVSGASVELQRAATPDASWLPLTNLIVPLNGVAEFTDTAPPEPGAFYRLRETTPPTNSACVKNKAAMDNYLAAHGYLPVSMEFSNGTPAEIQRTSDLILAFLRANYSETAPVVPEAGWPPWSRGQASGFHSAVTYSHIPLVDFTITTGPSGPGINPGILDSICGASPAISLIIQAPEIEGGASPKSLSPGLR